MIQRYAIIENGVVVNVTVSESALAPNWIQSDIADIGDLYIDGQIVKPAPQEPNP